MARVVMQGSTTVPPNGIVPNVLTGQKYERPPGDAMGFAYINGSAAGLEADLNVDGISVTDTIVVNTQNRQPVVPDDLTVGEWEAPEGNLIQLQFRNTTGLALTAQWRIELAEAQPIQVD